jgi:hypothetical protein
VDDRPYPVVQAGGGDVSPGGLDRLGIDVDRIDAHVRVGARDRDARPGRPAGEVGHAGGRFIAQAGVHIRDGGNPVCNQVDELRPVEGPDRLVDVVRLEGHPGAAAVGLEERFHRPEDVDRQRSERGKEVQGLLVDEHRPMGGRQRVASLAGLGVSVVYREEPGHRLLLEPLPHVALGRTRARRQLARRRLPGIGKRAIKAQSPTDVDGCELERVDHGPEQALDERLRLLGRVG